jgi:ABC-type lipoprotein release transport system permease subunit
MTTPWRKAVRDFWHERARTVLVVLAIALGISAFAAVMSSYAILTRELDRGYLETNPASAILRVDSIDDELVAAILKNPAVSDAEPRRIVTGLRPARFSSNATRFRWRGRTSATP